MAQRKIIRKHQYSLNFDGTTDFVAMGNNFATFVEYNSAQSYSCWIRFLGQHATERKVIISKANATAKGFHLFVNPVSVSQTLGLEWRSVADTNTLYVTVPMPSTEKWVHLVATYDGSVTSAGVKVYYDGVLQTTTEVTNNINATIVTAFDFCISGYFDGTQSWNGQISNVAIYNTALTQAQVNSIYFQNLHPASKVAHWPFTDGSGATLTETVAAVNGTINNATWETTLVPPFITRTLAS